MSTPDADPRERAAVFVGGLVAALAAGALFSSLGTGVPLAAVLALCVVVGAAAGWLLTHPRWRPVGAGLGLGTVVGVASFFA